MLIAAFEEFLRHFKTQTKTVDTINGMELDDQDEFSDEYDFADSDEEARQARRQQRQQAREPKLKYVDILRNVANRTEDEITIDLDDLDEVF
jgi:DNA replication licensing factor MCM7